MEQKIRDIFNQLGFPLVGFVGQDDAHLGPWVQPWLDRGYHGSMEWMTGNLGIREEPLSIHPGATSAIVLGMPYKNPAPDFLAQPERPLSRYAWGTDYHHWIRKRLKQGLARLAEQFEGFDGRGFVDSAPVPEKILAHLGGLGFIGKNSLLTHPTWGSYLFLSSVICNLPLTTTGPMDHPGCGTCDLCLDTCPNSAIMPGRQVNANRCISYLTIEVKGELTATQEKATQGHLFGCDRCQDCCPYNQTADYAPTPNPFEFDQRWADLSPEWVLSLDQAQFDQLKITSPLKRAGLEGLRRNALAGLGKK